MMRKIFTLSLFFLGLTFVAWGQSGSIKGFIYERSNGEPVIYTNVWLLGTSYGTQTDVNGYFSITGIAPGEYTLASTQFGYDTASTAVTVGADAILTKKLFLNRSGITLTDITVTSRKQERQTLVNVGVTTVTPKEMKLLPSAGGEPDIAQFLQVTPGVIFTGDQGGQLYVRGGAPSQTGVLLDGVTIYNPFHTIGLYSVFETDAIRSADIQTGGFNAQYGNRTSAIVDIHTKDGNKNRISGKLSASPIMARAMIEGPISKPKNDDAGSTTFLLSFKHSYLEQSSKAIYGWLEGPFEYGLPYNFTDIYGKVSFNSDNGSKLNLFGFNFNDKSKFLDPNTGVEKANFNWNATGGGATFVVSPAGSSTLIDGKFAYSVYDIEYNEANAAPRDGGIDGFEAGINFSNYLPNHSLLRYGVEVSGLHTNLSYTSPYSTPNNVIISDLDRRNTLAAAFVTWRKNFGEKLIIEPGFRAQYYATLNKFSPEPRIGMKYNVNSDIRLKLAGGMYSQNIISTKSDRDIVNFFTSFLLSPDVELKDPDGNTVKTNIQTAYHILGGIEVDVQNVEFNLEPWYKNFTQNIELNRYKGSLNPDGTVNNVDFIIENGQAFGIDLSARYSKNRIYLWGVAGYQKVTRYDGEQTYPPPFDRRFNLNLLAAYTVGKKKDIEISARYNMGSPFPFTQTQGFYEQLTLFQNGIGTNYLQQNGQIGLLFANEINGGRLSWYYRLDLSAKKRFILSPNNNIETTLAITNVTDRNNIFYVNRIDNTRVYQLPILPSINVTWNF